MELTNRQILIELPEWADKNVMFEIIAKGNGWTPIITKTVEKSVEIKGRWKAEEEIVKLKSEGKWFSWADYVKQEEEDEKSTFLVKYTENVEVENTPASVVGKDILIEEFKRVYAEGKLKIDTLEAQETLAKKQKESLEEVSKVWEITAE